MKTFTISEINELWSRVSSMIAKEVDKTLFDAFFRKLRVYGVNGDTIILVTDSALSKSILEQKYITNLEDKIFGFTNERFKLSFIQESQIEQRNEAQEELSSFGDFFKNSYVDPNYTFDNFVVGQNNQEAQKASLIVAETPGTIFQTLFIYGGSGLGKTHLLNAIGNYVKNASPEKKILYCSSQDFINEYLDFVNGDSRKDQLIKYLKKFDIFLIDDIQMLKDKKKTQEFFFNIYEDFRQNHKQVVLTSDRLPGELDGIDTRLITRFTSGLSVPVLKPDSHTCREILEAKLVSGGYDLSKYDEEVLIFLADKFKDSVRNLEGALIRLNFYVSINKYDRITLDVCADALRGMVDVSDAKNKVTEQKILNVVADYYSLSVAQITGKMKTGNIANARHVAIYLIRDMLDVPFKKIGATFSGRDHSTIMHSVETVDQMLKTDGQAKLVVEELKKRILS
ncbi:MAG: chromosomal replication initiator protein DnaA [Bacilli bacterium]|nr:chromosomal replication initiator protein DnaA [Bacilli bacterium]